MKLADKEPNIEPNKERVETDPYLLQYRMELQRTHVIWAATTITAATLLIVALYKGFGASTALTTREFFLFACIGIVALIELLATPWQRIESKKNLTILLSLWSACIGIAISTAVLFDGGIGSSLTLLYSPLLTFFALAFSARALAQYFAFLCVTYAIGSLACNVAITIASAVAALGGLALVTFTASMFSSWLKQEMHERARHLNLANTRAGMLGAVGRAARRVVSLDESNVIEGGLLGALELGCSEVQIWTQDYATSALVLRRVMGESNSVSEDWEGLAGRLFSEANESGATVREIRNGDAYIGCLLRKEQHPNGLFLARTPAINANDELVVECLEVLAIQISAGLDVAHNVSVRRTLEDQLAHWAFHDSLTDLPNRVLFGDRLELAIARTSRSGAKVAVLFLDLDGFKQVNDELGHGAGDALLRAVATRVKRCLRPNDTLARYGGDEFVILLEEINETQDAVAVAQRVLHALTEAIEIEAQEVAICTSIGIAMTSGGAGAESDVVRRADVAMYEAKAAGGACYVVSEYSA